MLTFFNFSHPFVRIFSSQPYGNVATPESLELGAYPPRWFSNFHYIRNRSPTLIYLYYTVCLFDDYELIVDNGAYGAYKGLGLICSELMVRTYTIHQQTKGLVANAIARKVSR